MINIKHDEIKSILKGLKIQVIDDKQIKIRFKTMYYNGNS